MFILLSIFLRPYYFQLQRLLEIGFQFFLSRIVFVLYVTDNDAVLQQGDTRAYVYRMVKVVAGDDDGRSVLLVVLFQQLLDDGLRAGVEEIERFVQYQ